MRIELDCVHSRFTLLQKKINQGTIRTDESIMEENKITRSLINFLHLNPLNAVEIKNINPIEFNSQEPTYTLRFLSRALNIDHSFRISSNIVVAHLKKALIQHYALNIIPPQGYDKVITNLWANHRPIENENLQLKEAGILDGDMIQIEGVYHKIMNIMYGPKVFKAIVIDFEIVHLQEPVFILQNKYKGDLLYKTDDRQLVVFQVNEAFNRMKIIDISILQENSQYRILDRLNSEHYNTYNNPNKEDLDTITPKAKLDAIVELVKKYSLQNQIIKVRIQKLALK